MLFAFAFAAALVPGSAPVAALRAPLSTLRVGFVPARGPTPRAPPSAMSGGEEGGLMGIGDLLKNYGVVALGFHFSVWLLTLALVFSVASVAGDGLLANLPDWIPGDAKAGGKIALTLGVVEVVGPARLALTVAATPAVSARLRRVPIARLALQRAEGLVAGAVSAVTSRLPGRGNDA